MEQHDFKDSDVLRESFPTQLVSFYEILFGGTLQVTAKDALVSRCQIRLGNLHGIGLRSHKLIPL